METRFEIQNDDLLTFEIFLFDEFLIHHFLLFRA
jgi:hypothetical protein